MRKPSMLDVLNQCAGLVTRASGGMADALASGASVLQDVGVQVPLRPQIKPRLAETFQEFQLAGVLLVSQRLTQLPLCRSISTFTAQGAAHVRCLDADNQPLECVELVQIEAVPALTISNYAC